VGSAAVRPGVGSAVREAWRPIGTPGDQPGRMAGLTRRPSPQPVTPGPQPVQGAVTSTLLDRQIGFLTSHS
jgi:hypothetical protein